MAKPSDASDANLLRSRSSYSVLPTLSYGSAAATPAARDPLPEPTHSLYFEYDCAAPYASVQIFIRASRKHGSWINWTPPAGPNGTAASDPLSSQFDKDGNPAWLSQSGPPPHVLGWPVHVAKIKKGFGSGHTAHIPLHLQYYAPPKAKKADRNAGAPGGDASDKDASDKRGLSFKRALEPPTPAAIPETPGFEFNRRLEVDADDADDDAAASGRPARAGASTAAEASQGSRTDPLGAAAALGLENRTTTAQPVIEEETKEQRLAREKAERETLKVAIVVEALDEHARPLREPNLQTSYMRLTSLPTQKSVAERLEDLTQQPSELETPRTWSSQVEGQEAEIGPHRFQLQELYGLSSKPPAVAPAPVDAADGDEDGATPAPPPVDIDASNGSECLICLSSLRRRCCCRVRTGCVSSARCS